MTSLAPIIIPTIAVIVTSASLLVAYIAKREADAAYSELRNMSASLQFEVEQHRGHALHWRGRAIDLSTQITEQQRLRSERTAKGNRTRAAKRRGL